MGKDAKDESGEIEEQFILRLPYDQAATLRNLIASNTLEDKLSISFVEGQGRKYRVKLEDFKLEGTLVDLPTLIESQKTLDGFNFYKTADISQMLLCRPADVATAIPISATYPHGLAPPFKNVRKRRFRRTAFSRLARSADVQNEVMRLMKDNANALSDRFELIDMDEDEDENVMIDIGESGTGGAGEGDDAEVDETAPVIGSDSDSDSDDDEEEEEEDDDDDDDEDDDDDDDDEDDDDEEVDEDENDEEEGDGNEDAAGEVEEADDDEDAELDVEVRKQHRSKDKGKGKSKAKSMELDPDEIAKHVGLPSASSNIQLDFGQPGQSEEGLLPVQNDDRILQIRLPISKQSQASVATQEPENVPMETETAEERIVRESKEKTINALKGDISTLEGKIRDTKKQIETQRNPALLGRFKAALKQQETELSSKMSELSALNSSK